MSRVPLFVPVIAALILVLSSSPTRAEDAPASASTPLFVGAAKSEEDGTVLLSASDLRTLRARGDLSGLGPVYTGTCYYIDSVSVINPGADCDSVPRNYTSFGRWIFYICTDPPNCTSVVLNCNVRLTVRAIQGDGFHYHADPNRPMGAPIDTSGNTGFDGFQFRIPFRWPQVAGPLEIRFFATDPCGPTDSSAVDWVYCLEAAPLVPPAPCPPCTGTPFNIPAVDFPLLPLGSDYDLTGTTPIHSLNHYGLRGMIDSLASAARAFRAKFPTGTRMGFNDMSLPYGGVFDADPVGDWRSPTHCGHRVGMECDFSTNRFGTSPALPTSNKYLRYAEIVLRARNFTIHPEFHVKHWHLKYYGPGTFWGPGSTLTKEHPQL